MAIQEGPTSIQVSWSPPISLGDKTGYRIFYSGASVDVSDGSIDNYLLSGLQNGGTYNISIVTTFNSNIGIFLDTSYYSITLGENYVHCVQWKLCTSYPSVPAPGQPSVNVTCITATSITLSWSVPSGSVFTSYEVMWRALSSGDGVSGTSSSITSTSYTIEELESNTVYSVTVTVTNVYSREYCQNPSSLLVGDFDTHILSMSIWILNIMHSHLILSSNSN